ncbi:MAG: 5-(carboxyamino)imidazole ribonucleotide synthase [Alphaproteobacteria bacterium]|nr:5-(carboxyamino)imidazole ribonucleotide synthase [Alphaproteobacteria bacterium]MCD8570812.1 5-(carboxyamino)imidazole ribonucleotide synthase [Alphaproteobacteria bacterium]
MKQTILGILGGGQLGRMSALAAARLGIAVHIFTPEEDSPASFVAAKTVVADYKDENALKDFAAGVDIITYEFENIPLETLTFLKRLRPVFPDVSLLEVSQNRIDEKTFLNKIGISTTRWSVIQSSTDVKAALVNWNADACILKTVRFGYDGKGQSKVRMNDDIDSIRNGLSGEILIAEEIVDFDCEISMIIARNSQSKTETYGPMLNEHRNHILHKTTVPSGLPADLCQRAVDIVTKLAENIDLIGVLTLEMFVTKNGLLLANEIAPRTHNSGHWSIDACACSQFENHVRAVCNLPLGSTERHSDAEMLNLIGDDILKMPEYMAQANACPHHYGKDDIREGRKMGHVTFLKPRKAQQN